MTRPATGDRLPLVELLRQAAAGTAPSAALEALIERVGAVK
ncbi:hypothetical protein [Pseudogemmobacter bohemicus]|nr:hypothetical protein [Pseudogemmobacter bohemicus]